ncbi:MAG: hypothetical protein PVI78_01565 [Anaerolineales bacterium]
MPISSLRRHCAHAISTTAFRRWLTSKNIPYELVLTAPLTDPLEHHITIGGRQVEIITTLITNRQVIRSLHNRPQSMLQFEFTAPSELDPTKSSPNDLLAYSLLIATISQSPSQTRNRMDASELVFLLAVPPRRIWRQQRPWRPLGKLILSSQDPHPISLDLCALLPDHSPTFKRATIPPGHPIELFQDWHNLLYMHTLQMPITTLRLHLPARKGNWFVTPSQWANLCFYDTRLVLAGWLTRREFNSINASQTVENQVRFRKKKAARIPLQGLRPLAELEGRMRHM